MDLPNATNLDTSSARARLEQLFYWDSNTRHLDPDHQEDMKPEKREVAIMISQSTAGEHEREDGKPEWHWSIALINGSAECEWEVVEMLSGEYSRSHPKPWSSSHGSPVVMVIAGSVPLGEVSRNKFLLRNGIHSAMRGLSCKECTKKLIQRAPWKVFTPYQSDSVTPWKAIDNMFWMAEELKMAWKVEEARNPETMRSRVFGMDYHTGCSFQLDIESI